MELIIIAIATFCATLLGGFFALRFKDNIHLILGFSAGAVIGVAFFDLVPEALEIAGKYYDNSHVISVVALGFALYLMMSRFVMSRGRESGRGAFGAAVLSLHSFLDGISIGLVFKISPSLGIIVAIAVLAHDFSDGINTVNYIIKNNGTKKNAFNWLLIDAIAPIAGILAAFFINISEQTLGLTLALFAGFFLYIGASDLIPESQHNHPVKLTTVATLFGMGFLYILVRLVS